MYRAAGGGGHLGAAEGAPGPAGAARAAARPGGRPGRAKGRFRVHETIVSEFI